MIITEIVSVFFIEIGQVCMLSRTLILELGRGCLFSSITSEKQWLRSKKGKGFRMHAAHPPPPAPLNFPGSLPGKPTWILIMGEGEIKLLASAGVSLLRSFSNNDRDDNGKVKKKATGLSSKTTTITLFCSFLSHHCKTAMWKCLISLFMENVHKWQWIFLSLSKP